MVSLLSWGLVRYMSVSGFSLRPMPPPNTRSKFPTHSSYHAALQTFPMLLCPPTLHSHPLQGKGNTIVFKFKSTEDHDYNTCQKKTFWEASTWWYQESRLLAIKLSPRFFLPTLLSNISNITVWVFGKHHSYDKYLMTIWNVLETGGRVLTHLYSFQVGTHSHPHRNCFVCSDMAALDNGRDYRHSEWRFSMETTQYLHLNKIHFVIRKKRLSGKNSYSLWDRIEIEQN